MNQMVRSPRRTSARSYSDQFVTRYLVLYVGWTFERLDIIHSMLEPVMYPTNGSPTGRISIHAPTPWVVGIGSTEHEAVPIRRVFVGESDACLMGIQDGMDPRKVGREEPLGRGAKTGQHKGRPSETSNDAGDEKGKVGTTSSFFQAHYRNMSASS